MAEIQPCDLCRRWNVKNTMVAGGVTFHLCDANIGTPTLIHDNCITLIQDGGYHRNYTANNTSCSLFEPTGAFNGQVGVEVMRYYLTEMRANSADHTTISLLNRIIEWIDRHDKKGD